MNKFIALEGVDGAGKTTVGKALAKSLGIAYMKTPGDQYESVRGYIDSEASPMTRLLFYLSSVSDASRQIGTTLGRNSVVCDRYLWSTFVPHAAYNGKDLQELEDLWKPVTRGIIQPHQTFLLQVDEDEQLRRLTLPERGKPSASDAFCFDTEKRRKARSLYEEVANRHNWIKIDTTDRSVESVIEEINSQCFGQVCAR